MREGPIVTLDGPAGSGKSSTAIAVARRLGVRHLDSGALYRALTLALLRSGKDPSAWSDLSETELLGLEVDIEPAGDGFTVLVGGSPVQEELRGAQVTRLVPEVARLPAVRGSLMALQRRAGAEGRLVADGRDMGTVVFPDAEVKVFVVADVDERARRRLKEQGGSTHDSEEVARQADALGARDKADSEREISPLKRADDAHDLDTTSLSFDEQVEVVVDLVHRLTLP